MKNAVQSRSLILFTFVFVSLSTAASADATESLVLAEAGRSDYRIALSKTATASERWAAGELQKYVSKMTGAVLPIVEQDKINSAKPAIWISPPSGIIKSVPELSGKGFGPEEFKIVADGNDVFIVGGQPRGVMYGVYELLENVWGCRWLTPDCEIIPNRKRLTLPAGFKTAGKPALEYRDVLFREAFDPLWAVRNRVPGAAYEFRTSLKDKGGRCGIWPLCHGMEYIAPFKKCKGANRDLLAQKTEGGVEHRSNCFSNPKLYEMAKQVVRQWLKTHPDAKAYDISQRDGSPDGCHCKKCQALIDAEGSQIAPILTMANRLAKDMKDELDGRYITVVAYNYSVDAPKTLRAEPNVVVRLCLAPTMISPTEKDYNNLKRWLTKTDRLWLWLYCNDYSKMWVPFPITKSYAEHLRHLAGLGVKGIMAQGMVKGGGDLPGLKAWVWAKTMWDPNADTDQLIETFTRGYYGKSGKAVRKYVDLMDKASRRKGDFEGSSFWNRRSLNYLNEKTLKQADDFLSQAYAMADDDTIRQRVTVAAFCVRYARMMNAIRPTPQLSDGKYSFGMTSQSFRDWQEWFKDVKSAGYKYGAEFEPIETLERSITSAGKAYETVTLDNSIVQATIVPELGARIVSLRLVPDGENLIHAGSLSKNMPYDAGVSETFGRHATAQLGDKAVYTVANLTALKVVLTTTLSNGQIITKTVSLPKNRPEVSVDITVQNTTQKDSPVQRLHIKLHTSRDAGATRKIYYFDKNDGVQKFLVGKHVRLLMNQHSPLVQSAAGWILHRKNGPYLLIKPSGKALDMALNSEDGYNVTFMRIGMGGWVARANDSKVHLGYTIQVKGRE